MMLSKARYVKKIELVSVDLLHIIKDSAQIPILPKAVALLAGVYKLTT